jgi:salicylate hydroxylase
MARIIVAGGGIAGLAAAIAATRAGHEVLVCEQASRFEEVGAGIQMGPNGRRALEWLGAWEALSAQVFYPAAVRIRRGDGRDLGRVPLGEEVRRRFGTTYQVAHRADLLAALLEVARRQPGVELRTGVRVTGWRDTAGNKGAAAAASSRGLPEEPAGVPARGGVEVMAEEGALDAEESRGDALIGADGIRSAIRARLLGDGPPRPAGHVLYRALVDMERVPPSVDVESVNLWLHPGGHVVHYPVSGGRRFNIVAAVDENWQGEGWSSPSAGERLREVFAGVCGALADVLALPSGWLRWPGADRPAASRWGEGAITLMGDAAHPTLPYLASGAVMALEDAVVLGQELLAAGPAARGEGLAAAFRRYEARRRPRTSLIVARSHALGRIYHARPPLALGRDLFIRAQSGPRALSRMAWLYGWQP